jgi:L-amino acid N-acyltransferase YncA
VAVRPAVEDDLVGLTAIYNDIVATTSALWTTEPTTVAERRRWLAGRHAGGFPVLVAEEGGQVVGFASYGTFRHLAGYDATVEHTVHVAPGHRRREVGRALVTELVAVASQEGRHAMVGAIDADNLGSLAFHGALGFAEVGRLPEVGRRFDRWQTLVLVERLLDDPGR